MPYEAHGTKNLQQMPSPVGRLHVVCERDVIKQLDLICARRSDAESRNRCYHRTYDAVTEASRNWRKMMTTLPSAPGPTNSRAESDMRPCCVSNLTTGSAAAVKSARLGLRT